ncbi:MAG: trypsin-like peptidase domain-containing protein [Bacilli bacterium]|nr:trypsin-like peptidase domain-containing protein [Bacilli bacterium]
MNRRKYFKFFIFYVFTIISSILAVILYLYYFPSSKVITQNKTINETKLTEEGVESSIENVYDSVVTVESYKNSQTVGSGTGFIYKQGDNQGFILTNHHVIDGSDKVQVILNNKETIDVKVLGSDEYTDIAVLSIPKDKITKVATLGDSDNIKLGSTVITVGSPMGSDYSGSITRGIISGKDRMIENNSTLTKVIQTDAAINPGNSGGPLVNLAGEVIGITSMKLAKEEIEGMGFAIPINDVKNYVEYLEKGQEIKRPSIGITVINVTDKYSLYRSGMNYNLGRTSGVVIAQTVKGASAEVSGLRQEDIITKFDDNEIKDISTLRYYLYQYKTGDTIKVTYIRDGKENTLNMKLIEK